MSDFKDSFYQFLQQCSKEQRDWILFKMGPVEGLKDPILHDETIDEFLEAVAAEGRQLQLWSVCRELMLLDILFGDGGLNPMPSDREPFIV